MSKPQHPNIGSVSLPLDGPPRSALQHLCSARAGYVEIPHARVGVAPTPSVAGSVRFRVGRSEIRPVDAQYLARPTDPTFYPQQSWVRLLQNLLCALRYVRPRAKVSIGFRHPWKVRGLSGRLVRGGLFFSAVALSCLTLTACGSTTPKQVTMAEVCASHAEDMGHIAAGLFAFKYAMDAENRALFTPEIATTVEEAVANLRAAAFGATSANLEAARHFLQLLQGLSEGLAHPPKFPTATFGDQDVSEIEHAAQRVGCKL